MMSSFNANAPGRNLAPSKECLGCKSCSGVCREIVELMTIPAIVLKTLGRKKT